jgi:hypothetical protein
VSIIGPECVTTETSYQYLITGIDSALGVQVCVNNGTIVGAEGNCIDSARAVKIVWNSAAVNASISVRSSAGNTTLNVTIRSALGGGLNTSNTIQTIDSGSTPQPVYCSIATGGDCNPQYVYQWQQSNNRLEWQDMNGKTTQNLDFLCPTSIPMFYRRKVTETHSGTIRYSNVASVFIIYKEDEE